MLLCYDSVSLSYLTLQKMHVWTGEFSFESHFCVSIQALNIRKRLFAG